MRIFSFLTLLTVTVSGVICVTQAYAAPEEEQRPPSEITQEKQSQYESAKRALKKSPSVFIVRKNMLASYLGVIDARLAALHEAFRMVNISGTNDDIMASLNTDRAMITRLLTDVERAKTPQDLARVTASIKGLRIFANEAARRTQVLVAHRNVLTTQGIAVLETRLAQIDRAANILADDGKDVTTLRIMLTATQDSVASAKLRLSQLPIEYLNDDALFESNKSELFAIEGIIRGAFDELAALSEKGKEIRDGR